MGKYIEIILQLQRIAVFFVILQPVNQQKTDLG
jgi:hypothetical protein